MAIGVIGLLLALVIPAVQRSREAARGAQCQSHLKQIMTACHSYESVHRMLPPGAINFVSQFVRILPDMEEQALFDQVDFSLAPRVQLISIEERRPAWLRCPSDPEPDVVRRLSTSYAGNAGTGAKSPLDHNFNGAFQPLSEKEEGTTPVRIHSVIDGLSVTVGLSELLPGRKFPSYHRTIWETAPIEPSGRDPETFSKACVEAAVAGGAGDHLMRGHSWVEGSHLAALYTHVLPPNGPSCTNVNWVPGGAFTAASAHPGRVHAVFVDGHVRSLSESIDADLWRALGSRNGREVLSKF